jgi:hypothetical protein
MQPPSAPVSCCLVFHDLVQQLQLFIGNVPPNTTQETLGPFINAAMKQVNLAQG